MIILRAVETSAILAALGLALGLRMDNGSVTGLSLAVLIVTLLALRIYNQIVRRS